MQKACGCLHIASSREKRRKKRGGEEKEKKRERREGKKRKGKQAGERRKGQSELCHFFFPFFASPASNAAKQRMEAAKRSHSADEANGKKVLALKEQSCFACLRVRLFCLTLAHSSLCCPPCVSGQGQRRHHACRVPDLLCCQPSRCFGEGAGRVQGVCVCFTLRPCTHRCTDTCTH